MVAQADVAVVGFARSSLVAEVTTAAAYFSEQEASHYIDFLRGRGTPDGMMYTTYGGLPLRMAHVSALGLRTLVEVRRSLFGYMDALRVGLLAHLVDAALIPDMAEEPGRGYASGVTL